MKKFRVSRGTPAIEGETREDAISKAYKEKVHISAIRVMELRMMLHARDVDTFYMTEAQVRRECVQRFGAWYYITSPT